MLVAVSPMSSKAARTATARRAASVQESPERKKRRREPFSSSTLCLVPVAAEAKKATRPAAATTTTATAATTTTLATATTTATTTATSTPASTVSLVPLAADAERALLFDVFRLRDGVLDLGSAALGADGAKAVAAQLAELLGRGLLRLHLGGNCLGDKGLAELLDALSLASGLGGGCGLRRLNLR
ncbi:unnamed protein product, partial [Polarella glacialis]